MSVKIGQFRRTSKPVESYKEEIAISQGSDIANDVLGTTVKDVTLVPTNKDVFVYGNNYFLTFTLKGYQYYDFTVKLYREDGREQSVAFLSKSSDEQHYELVISPNESYTTIVLEINRNNTASLNYKINVSNMTLYNIVNILDSIGHSPLTKIGVQGPKSFIMCINGEKIMIGNSGAYELDNKIDITFFGVIIKELGSTALPHEDGYQNFILDYQYEEEV